MLLNYSSAMRQIVCSNILFNQVLLKFVSRSLQDVKKMNFILNRKDIKKEKLCSTYYILLQDLCLKRNNARKLWRHCVLFEKLIITDACTGESTR